jgi:acetaldehyde dehydrogenase (acetylating)
MPIHQTAHYQVNESADEDVKAAIVEFVRYVKANEPGTRLYAAWQQEDDPTLRPPLHLRGRSRPVGTRWISRGQDV